MNRFLAGLSLLGLAACSTTDPGSVSDLSKQPRSGFLSDYSQLSPGGKDEALMVYIDRAAPWRSYTKARIEPVTFWGDAKGAVPVTVQEQLCDYAYSKLTEQLGNELTLVDEAGPGVMVIRAALIDASAATPGLRTISMVVPQMRLLGAAKREVTGSYAFVGSARSEGEVTDGVSGHRLAAWIDERVGGGAIESAGVWEWGDAQHVIDYWAVALAKRVHELRS